MHITVPETSAHRTARKLFRSSLFNPWGLVKNLFCRLWGRAISEWVLPAQRLSKEENFIVDTITQEQDFATRIAENNLLQQKLYSIESFAGTSLETMELMHKTQWEKPKSQQKYVIYLCGNGMCMQDLYQEIYNQCLLTQCNFVTFNLKNVMRSRGNIRDQVDLINDVITQIERLKQEGVAITNICLMGHSLGAALVTLASFVYLQEGTPIRVFNDRSFANFADMIYFQEKNRGNNVVYAWFKKVLLLLANFKLEVATYYDLIPERYRDYLTIDETKSDENVLSIPDGVIAEQASLRSAVKDKATKHLVHSTCTLFGIGHNDPLSTLQCVDEEIMGDERCRKFILQ